MKKMLKFGNLGLLMMIVAGFTLISSNTAFATCPDNLAAYWKLNETSGAPYVDFLGDNDGAVAPLKVGPLAATGIVGWAQEFTDATGARTGIDVPADSDAMQEEIFGPVLPILRYTQLDDVIADINTRDKPLAMYIFSRSRAHIDQVLRETSAGGTCINDTLLHFLNTNLPFGGIGSSGIGRGHGHAGFMAFSNERAVLRQHLSPVWITAFDQP